MWLKISSNDLDDCHLFNSRWRYYHRLARLTSAPIAADASPLDAAFDQQVVADRPRRQIFKRNRIAHAARIQARRSRRLRRPEFSARRRMPRGRRYPRSAPSQPDSRRLRSARGTIRDAQARASRRSSSITPAWVATELPRRARRSYRWRAPRRFAGVVTSIVDAVERCRKTRARGEVRSCASTTTRTGSRPPSIRQVRRGLSAITVPAPTITASHSRRHRWTSARDSRELIHCESPLAAAIRPSSDIASLSIANGRPSVTRVMKPSLSRRRFVFEHSGGYFDLRALAESRCPRPRTRG